MSIYFNYCCMCRTHREIRQGDSLPASLYTTLDLSYHRAVIYSQAYQSQAYSHPLIRNIKLLFLTHLLLNQTVIMLYDFIATPLLNLLIIYLQDSAIELVKIPQNNNFLWLFHG